MDDTLKTTYSVVIQWSARDADMGDYGECVKARDSKHAERIVRAMMIRNEWSNKPDETKSDAVAFFKNSDGSYFGPLISCDEGAIWKAADLEKALRECVAWMRAELDGRLPVEFGPTWLWDVCDIKPARAAKR